MYASSKESDYMGGRHDIVLDCIPKSHNWNYSSYNPNTVSDSVDLSNLSMGVPRTLVAYLLRTFCVPTR